MKHLLHLVRADLRRFWLLLTIWVSIAILETVFTAVSPMLASDVRLLTALGLLGAVLLLARWLGMVVIVALVVQTHALVGSDAFWMTRPISWRALLGSKIVLLATTFVVAPALCQLVLMAISRVPIGEMILVLLQSVLLQTLAVVVVMALSSTTRNLARFALVAGGLLVGLVLAMYVGLAVAIRNIPDGPQLSVLSVRSASSSGGAVVLLLLLIGVPLGQLFVQYRTRLTRLAVGMGTAGIVIVILLTAVWPSRDQPLPVPPWASGESELRPVAMSSRGAFSRLNEWSSWNSPSDGWQMGRAQLRLRGLEGGWLATVALADASLQLDDGTKLTTVGNGYSEPISVESVDDVPSRAVMRHVLGVGQVWDDFLARRYQEQAMPAIVVSEADFRRHSGATGIYRGQFMVHLDHVEIAATLPLRAGAEFRERHRRVVIEQIIPHPQAASVRMRLLTTATIFDSQSLAPLSFYLRNHSTNEAVATSPAGSMGMSALQALPMFVGASAFSASPGIGFNLTADGFRFPPQGYVTPERMVDITAEWLAQAELVVVRTVPAGSVMRSVEIQGFEMAAAGPRLPR